MSILPQQKFIATIPLVMYLSGFFSSFLMNPVNKWIGRNVSVWVGGGQWGHAIDKDPQNSDAQNPGNCIPQPLHLVAALCRRSMF